MHKRLTYGIGIAALAATLAGTAASSASASATAEAGPVVAEAEDVQFVHAGTERIGELRVTVRNTNQYWDESRFLVHLPQSARFAAGQPCVLFHYNRSQWLCEGVPLEPGESYTHSLTVRAVQGGKDYHGWDSGYVSGLSITETRSADAAFRINWPPA